MNSFLLVKNASGITTVSKRHVMTRRLQRENVSSPNRSSFLILAAKEANGCKNGTATGNSIGWRPSDEWYNRLGSQFIICHINGRLKNHL